MGESIVASVIGGLIVVFVIEATLRLIIPWIRTKIKVNIDLKGTWVAKWVWDNSAGEARDEIQIDWQSGNEIRGRRRFVGNRSNEYILRGYYKDSLFVAHFWAQDASKRYGGTIILRLDDNGKTLSGKVMYPEDGNLKRFKVSNINDYVREQ